MERTSGAAGIISAGQTIFTIHIRKKIQVIMGAATILESLYTGSDYHKGPVWRWTL